MALTDTKVKAAKLDKGRKSQKFADSGGLFLLVNKSGKYWRLKYRLHGKEKVLSIGVYSQVSLKQAREAREQAKAQLSKGIDPSQAKQAAKRKQSETKQASTFGGIAEEWLNKNREKWASSTHTSNKARLTNHITPWLGSLPIQDIKAIDVLSVCRRVEGKGHIELAHRVRNICGQVMRYAVATCRIESDSTRDLRGALAPVVSKHRARITDPKAVGQLMRAIQSFSGTHIVACALRLTPYVFLRPGELRKLQWSWVDFEKDEIHLPAEIMKMKRPFTTPLSQQAKAILEDVQHLTGGGKYVFQGARSISRPMSENTINKCLRRLGYDTTTEQCAHGFRGTASTLLNEQGFRKDFIELQLSHCERDQVRAAYNDAEHLPERVAMMQHYADYLDGLRDGAQVIPIHKRTA